MSSTSSLRSSETLSTAADAAAAAADGSARYVFDASKLRRLADVCANAHGSASRHCSSGSSSCAACSSGSSVGDCVGAVQPVVVVLCGSFNPIHNAHLALYDAAKRKLEHSPVVPRVGDVHVLRDVHTTTAAPTTAAAAAAAASTSTTTTTTTSSLSAHATPRRYAVLGGFLSPVNDAYGKPGLLPFRQRVDIMHAALRLHHELAVDEWEGLQPTYTYTYHVLQHVQHEVQRWYAAHEPAMVAALAAHGTVVRVVFACGSDLFSTFFLPGCWPLNLLQRLLDDVDLVVVTRAGRGLVNSTDDLRRRMQQRPLEQEVDGRVYTIDLSRYTFLFTHLRTADHTSSTAIRRSIAKVYATRGRGRSARSAYEQARCTIAAMVPADAVDSIVKVYAQP